MVGVTDGNGWRQELAGGGPDRPSRSRRSLQAAAGRDRVLDAAIECIDDVGISRASSNEIARRAGMSWGAIQHHFGSRDGLLLSVIGRNFTELEAHAQEGRIADGTLADRLQEFADLIWEYCSDPRYRVTMEILLDMQRDPKATASVDELLAATDQRMSELWLKQFEAVVGSPVERVYERLLFGVIRGLALTLHMNTMHRDFTHERALLVEMLADAIAKDEPALGERGPDE